MSDKLLEIRPSPSGTECWLILKAEECHNGEYLLCNVYEPHKHLVEELVKRCNAYPKLVQLLKNANIYPNDRGCKIINERDALLTELEEM